MQTPFAKSRVCNTKELNGFGMHQKAPKAQQSNSPSLDGFLDEREKSDKCPRKFEITAHLPGAIHIGGVKVTVRAGTW